MKNIHLITTSQPSRLLCNHTLKSFCFQKEENGMFVNDGKVSGASFWSIEKAKNNGFNPQHIYITNDEVIKAGDYFWKPDCNMIFKAEYTPHKGCEKVILTTDQDLINDNVQSIDDEFLEWFVKNPSCEKVTTAKGKMKLNDDGQEYGFPDMSLYKIIIPQDEAKERAKNYMSLKGALEPNQIKCYCGHTSYCDCSPLEEPKQETLEEVAENYADKQSDISMRQNPLEYSKSGEELWYESKVDFKEGAKWQQERMYSEEDMKQAYLDGCKIKLTNIYHLEKWFEQFKKK
jgi:hypothetical protein